MKKHLFTGLSFLFALSSLAQETTVTSPDSNLKVDVNVKNGIPVYSVSYKEKTILEDSPLGVIANIGDFSKNIEWISNDNKKVNKLYKQDRIKKSEIHYEANQLSYNVKNSEGKTLQIEFMVSNNDIAFRYNFPKYGETASIRIEKENSGFRFPSFTTTFMCPQSDAMIGWKRTKPSYEEEYKADEPLNTPSKFGHGYTFPCLFHIGDNGWALVSETGVDSKYCGSHLSDSDGNGTYSIAFPMAEENNGNGTVAPGFSLPGSTPWRTITVGSNLKPIVETTIPWNITEPSYKSENDYKFGRGTWSWILWQDGSINYEDQVKYIDLAAAMGYEYVLVDNWWDKNIGRSKMEELIKYAQSKKVDVFLWYSSSGYWNDIEQGPINYMDNSIIRKKEMRWMKEQGVKGIKVDFFGGDKQETIRLYESILSDADDNGLMVIFHGCTIPRGWERMYPNYVGSEAVLASENLIFNQHYCDEEAFASTLHPFIRNTIGCMEYGGVFLNKRMDKSNKKGNIRRTTDGFQIATAVLFQNPIQNFTIAPNNLTDASEIALDFMKKIPTTWEDIKFIDGYPGKYSVLARKHGGKWYIAGINALKEPLKLKLDLSMLNKGEKVILYNDNRKLELVKEEITIKKPQQVEITLQPEGGMIITQN